tara:strand:- start:5822 stop:5926 length:105 start_codon:yes stop_codon:yes gene_type:complete
MSMVVYLVNGGTSVGLDVTHNGIGRTEKEIFPIV